MVDEATRKQIDAANPGTSTWLTANAGSGKTRVLTDRVARILLDGADPENILCLTYTKAAAAEMQNRLFKRLGAWAMKDDADLRSALTEIGVASLTDLARARTLFARAIETPGGIKIQTIHAFCAMLLRRFPLEAGVSPGFRELDDADARRLRQDVVEAMCEAEAPEVQAIARYLSDDDFDSVAVSVADRAHQFRPDLTRADLAECLGVPNDLTGQALVAEFVGDTGADVLTALKMALASGTEKEAGLARKLEDIDPNALQIDDQRRLESVFLYGAKAKAPFGSKAGKFPTNATRSALKEVLEPLDAMMDRAARLRESRLALAALEKSDALRRFAQAFLPAYDAAKAARGVLDFSDLIAKTATLLSDPAVADWVLYRLDGSIDHVLVDEAQDTSPAQWVVIDRITTEMTSGLGARADIARTLFVVGDIKQSIYSFQGADPREMDRMRSLFAERLRGGSGLAQLELVHSFRSAPAILRTVDMTFASERAVGLGDAVSHVAFHERKPGRVDLWPLEEPAEKSDDAAWYEPIDLVAASAPGARLARRIAGTVRSWTRSETIPAKNGELRPVTESDVLILVQSRSGANALFHQIIRACKAEGLAVAGADRLRIQSELAARDIMATLSFLALPEDDLALASALRSPLFGWSEAELYTLAQPRGDAFLWQALRKKDGHETTRRILDDLLDSADFRRPYELIERLLTHHGGRAKLLGRLGSEAEEGLDALLAESMRYEEQGPPSLDGFLSWYDRQETEIKRQAAGTGAGLRVMTVHGAKGLESPIVILPDTLRDDRERAQTVLVAADGTPLASLPKAERSRSLATTAAASKAADEEERRRLLYVAMTRAEHWLVVAGAGKAPTGGTTWYEAVADGLSAAGGVTERLADGGTIQRLETGDWSGSAMPDTATGFPSVTFPDWIDRPDRVPPVEIRPLLPSSLGGPKALPGELQIDDAERDVLAYGTHLHRLLEHLNAVPPPDRWAAAKALLPGIEEASLLSIYRDAVGLLDTEDLAEVFGQDSLAEVSFVSSLDGKPLQGTIDRLIVRSDRVTAVDFKSNRIVPERAEDVPEGLLRQMGAYAEALAQIYPGRRVETAILWTVTGNLMPLPHEIVSTAVANAATS